MTKIKIRKRVLLLVLAVLTVFMAVFTPYHTVEVEAADIGITYGIVDSSYEVLQWILMMMGIGGFQAPNVGVKEDEKGRVVDEFCKEFFCDTWDQWCDQNGIDPSAFKDDFIEVLNQDYDAAAYVAGDIKSSILNTLYNYLYSQNIYTKINLNCKYSDILIDSDHPLKFDSVLNYSGHKYVDGSSFSDAISKTYDVACSFRNCMPILILEQSSDSSFFYRLYLVSDHYFRGTINGSSFESNYNERFLSDKDNTFVFAQVDYQFISAYLSSAVFNAKVPFAILSADIKDKYKDSYYLAYDIFYKLKDGVTAVDTDLPNIAGKDYAFDLVGYPWAWDTDQPDVKPWDGVDSLPIPGDIAIGDSFPGVVDLPGVETGVIDGSIPWPDVIQMIKDIDTTPDPDPQPDPDPDKPDDEVELPAILPDGVGDKLNELKKKFPFCIPFDLVNCVKSVGSSNATPPKFTLEVPIPTTDKTYTFTVDLEMFSPYIGVFKAGIFAIFLIGLMFSTRKLIAWQID